MDLNKAIYEALAKEAQSYFSEISSKFPAGTYNCKQVKELMLRSEVLQERQVFHKTQDFNEKDPFVKSVEYENGGYNVTVLNSGKIVSIEIETFRTSFDACKIFDHLPAYKKLAGAKGNILFTVAEKMETCMEFQFDMRKEYKNLLKYVATDGLRPVMDCVNLHIANQELVASDGHILGIYPVSIKNLTKDNGDYSETMIQLPSDTFRKCTGIVTVSVSKDFKKIIVSDNTGLVFTQDYVGRYPNYRSVLNPVIKDAYVDFDKESIKEFSAYIKSIMKSNKYLTDLTFHFVKGSSDLSVTYNDIDFAINKNHVFRLKDECTFNLNIKFDAKILARVLNDWNGRIWLKGYSYAAYFDGKCNNLSLVMPRLLDSDTTIYDNISGTTTDVYFRPGGFKPEKLDLTKDVTSANMEPATEPALSETPVSVPVDDPIQETSVKECQGVKVQEQPETVQAVQPDSTPAQMTDAVQAEEQNTAQTPAAQNESSKQPDNRQEHNPRTFAPGYCHTATYTREVAALHTIIRLMLVRNYIALYTGENKSVKIRGAPLK